MGWFKRMFSMEDSEDDSPEEMEEEDVSIDDLPEWVDDRSNTGFEVIRPQIEEQFERLFEQKKILLSSLDDLSNAELHNPNITEREKQLMEGNRSAYISQHKQFLNFLNISEEISCRETAQFCNNFEELLVKLAKSTGKGHMVMKEFFANHANQINKEIKTMSDTISKIKELLDEGNVGVEMLGDVQKAVAELRSKNKLLRELDDELVTLKKKLANSNFLKDKLLKNREALKQGEDYAEFKEADQQKQKHKDRLKDAEAELDSLFSPLQRAMRKFSRIVVEDSDLFDDYMDNPLKALANDDGLKIIRILDRMKSSLESGSLELKDADKAIQRIADIKETRLKELHDSCIESRSAVKRIDNEMRTSSVLQEMDDLHYKVEHAQNQIKILEDKIEKTEQTRNKIDLTKLREAVHDKINDAFNCEVNITWPEGPSHTASQHSSSE